MAGPWCGSSSAVTETDEREDGGYGHRAEERAGGQDGARDDRGEQHECEETRAAVRPTTQQRIGVSRNHPESPEIQRSAEQDAPDPQRPPGAFENRPEVAERKRAAEKDVTGRAHEVEHRAEPEHVVAPRRRAGSDHPEKCEERQAEDEIEERSTQGNRPDCAVGKAGLVSDEIGAGELDGIAAGQNAGSAVADRLVSQGRERRDRKSDRHGGRDVVPVHVLVPYTGSLAPRAYPRVHNPEHLREHGRAA